MKSMRDASSMQRQHSPLPLRRFPRGGEVAFRSKLECMMLGVGGVAGPASTSGGGTSAAAASQLVAATPGALAQHTDTASPASSAVTSPSVFASGETSPATPKTPLTLLNGGSDETPLRPPARRVPPPRRAGIHHAARRARRVSAGAACRCCLWVLLVGAACRCCLQVQASRF